MKYAMLCVLSMFQRPYVVVNTYYYCCYHSYIIYRCKGENEAAERIPFPWNMYRFNNNMYYEFTRIWVCAMHRPFPERQTKKHVSYRKKVWLEVIWPVTGKSKAPTTRHVHIFLFLYSSIFSVRQSVCGFLLVYMKNMHHFLVHFLRSPYYNIIYNTSYVYYYYISDGYMLVPLLCCVYVCFFVIFFSVVS